MLQQGSVAPVTFACRPLPDETLLSWLERLAEANEHDRRTFLATIFQDSGLCDRDILGGAMTHDHIAQLSSLTDIPFETLQAMEAASRGGICCDRYDIYCFECWTEDLAKGRDKVYGRQIWANWASLICHDHGVALHDWPAKASLITLSRLVRDHQHDRYRTTTKAYQSLLGLLSNLSVQLLSLHRESDTVVPACFDPLDDVATALFRNFTQLPAFTAGKDVSFLLDTVSPWASQAPYFFQREQRRFYAYGEGPKDFLRMSDLVSVADRRFYLVAGLLVLGHWGAHEHPFRSCFSDPAWSWLMARAKCWQPGHLAQLQPLTQTVVSSHSGAVVPHP